MSHTSAGPTLSLHARRPRAALAASTADLVTTLRGLGCFQHFLDLLEQAHLLDDLVSGEWTVFAPTDAAFARLGPEAASILEHAPLELSIELAEHHVARGVVEVTGRTVHYQSLQGSPVVVSRDRVDGVSISRSDLHCRNGVLHTIDGLLAPPWVTVRDFEKRVRRFVDDHRLDLGLARGPFACDPGFLLRAS